MELRSKKDMQRQVLLSAITVVGLVVVLPVFMFILNRPASTPTAVITAPPSSTAIYDGNTCARIGFNWIMGGQVPVTPKDCLDDIAFAQRNGWDVMQTLQKMKRDNDRQSCLNSQRTLQGQDACRRQYP